MKTFSFRSDGLKLDGTFFYPSNKKEKNPTILFVHGWTGERKRSFQYAQSLSKLGYICMLFDMRGHGTSEGDINTFTIGDFFSDVTAAYDYLSKTEGVDPENISAVGSSFGGYLIPQLAEKRKIKNLALRVPADYPNEDFNKLKKFSSGENPKILSWRNKSKKFSKTFALSAIHNFPGKILVIESEKDDIVPHQTILNYLNAVKDRNKLTHIIMKDAPHSIPEGKFRDEIEKTLISWFSKI